MHPDLKFNYVSNSILPIPNETSVEVRVYKCVRVCVCVWAHAFSKLYLPSVGQDQMTNWPHPNPQNAVCESDQQQLALIKNIHASQISYHSIYGLPIQFANFIKVHFQSAVWAD